MPRFTATQILAIGGNTWTPSNGGAARIYLNEWARLIGLETEHYNTGNISYAALNGEKISNSKAYKILGGSKVYYNTADGKIYFSGGARDYMDEVIEGITAELTAIEEAAHAEDTERTPTQTEVTAVATKAEVDAPTAIATLRATGMTVRAIAAAMGVATSTIYRWARAAFRPRAHRAAALAALTA